MKIVLGIIIANSIISCARFKELVENKPPKIIRDERCYESQKFKVLQILEEGMLVHVCPTSFPSYYDNAFDACILKGELSFISLDPKEHDFVDEQNVEISESQCMQANGTHTYTAGKDKTKKTIRKVKIVESKITNPDYK